MARSNIQNIPAAGTAPTQDGPSGREPGQAPSITVDTGSPLKNGLARMTSLFFGRARGSQTTEKRTQQVKAVDADDTVHEEEDAVPTSPSRSNVRKRPLPRDIYAIPVSPHGSDQEEETRVNGPRKRLKTSVKAKKSIIAPKRSSGNSIGVPNLRSRAEPDRRAKTIDAAVSAPVQSIPPKAIKDAAPQPAKRPRGRPRKNAVASPTPVAAPKVSRSGHPPKNHLAPPTPVATVRVSTRGRRPKSPPTLPSPVAAKKVSKKATIPDEAPASDEHDDEVGAEHEEEEEEEEEEDQEEDYGVSSILMNPSPIKVARSINGQGPKRPSTEAGGSKDKKLKSGNDTPQESENEDGFDTEESEEEQEADPEGEPEGEPEEDYGGLLIKGRVLDDMMSFADRVGHYFNRESMTWTKKKAPIVCSHNGKRFMRRVEAIQKAYKTLRNAINAEDVQGSKEARHSVADLVQELQTESQSILTTRLGNPSHGIEFFDVHKTQTMLQDVYFHIIPGLLKVLKVATDVYPPKRSMKQSALRHLSVFTTMLEDLATAALLQPKIFQPGAESKYDTHHVRKPTSLIMPEIRTIQKALSGELAKRELVRKATKFEASQPERNRQVAEQERRQDEEIRRLRKENRRLQREAYETLCSEPRWGPLLRYKNEARNENALSQDLHSASRSGRNGRSQNVDDDQDIQDIDDPFAEEEEEEEEEEDVVDGPRLSLFPKNNTNDSTHSRPLSEKEKETFVECMRTEHGDDRYEKAAEQLGRSIEEIFTFAKDLQEAMDRKREQGQFMERHDSWTYDIWVEKQSGSG